MIKRDKIKKDILDLHILVLCLILTDIFLPAFAVLYKSYILNNQGSMSIEGYALANFANFVVALLLTILIKWFLERQRLSR